MQKQYTFSRLANLASILTSLLAATSFLAGSWQAQGQSPAATSGNRTFVPSGGLVSLDNHTPSKVLNSTAIRVSHYNPENKLRLVLAVKDSHIAEEDQFIKELTTKGSAEFHKFLTQEEWNARFAPAVEDEQTVVDWAESQGLTVTNRYPNRLLVDVEGTAGTIEKAFGVTINNYQVGDEVDFSNDRNPVIPANLSGILQAVAGLNNIERVHRIGSRYKTVKGADYAAGPVIADGGGMHGVGDPTKVSASRAPTRNENASASGEKPSDSYPLDYIGSTYAMNPDNIWSSEGYNYNGLQRFSHCCNVHDDTSGSPAVSSIALVGYGAFNFSDVETFFDFYGLAYNFNVWLVDGSAPAVDGEAPLDVEYSGAMSNNPGTPNNTAHIYEYEMADGSLGTYEDAFAQIVSQDHAKVVSTSYGGTEALSGPWNTAETGALHTTFNNMVAKGYTLIAASGDNGASDGCGNATDVDYPSSDPDFLAAGGTQLTLNDSGIYQSEIGWQGEFWTSAQNNGNGGACDNNHGGSTGGVSALFTAPWWQSSSGTTINLLSPTYEWRGGDANNPAGSEYYYTGNTHRLLPDMALTANPDVLGQWYYSTCCKGGGWQDEGGTSIVAPELAGFFAQENTYLNYIGNICGSDGTSACTPVGLASPFIYQNGAGNTNHDPFYDMLSGCSDNDDTVQYDLYYYCAAKGFDLVTGWGSANMMQLAWGINWQLIPAYSQPVITFDDKPATSVWYNTDQEVSWTVTDGLSQGTGTPSGVAGFTQGWDSIAADPYSEPHSGEGNSFYSGPEYAFGTTGCLSFAGLNGCSSAASPQGCHTVNVEAWDNQGSTKIGTYGPVCYDTVAPTVTVSNSPATSSTKWVNKPVVVTLTATDPGGSNASGIAFTAYDVENPESDCYPGSYGTGCYSYTGPITISTQGQTYIYYFAKDKAGNYSTETYEWVSIDTTPPVTTATLGGTLNSGYYTTSVGITLSATDNLSGVAKTYYSVDGGANTTYSGSPFTVSALGTHSVTYWSVDVAGNSETPATVVFTIHSPTTATLTATPNPSINGQSVTMTATITASLSGTPTGAVQFWNGATSLGTATLSSGVATLSTTALPVGALTLQASYLGAGNFIASNSVPYDQKVNETTTTALTSSLNPANVGQKVTFTATVTPSVSGTPTGTVSLYQGSSLVATSTLSGGVATLAVGFVDAGASPMKVVYSGDSTYLTSTSSVVTETVDKSPTTTSVVSSLNPSVTGQTVTFTATVTRPAGIIGVPTGTVIFKDGSTTLGSATLNSSGIATFTSSTLAGGAQTINAGYPGDGNDLASASTLTQTVEPPPTLTSPSPSSVLPGTSATFTWTAETGSAGYWLYLGSTGVGSKDLYDSGELTATSATFSSLPTNGKTIYARVYAKYGSILVYNDYTYTTAAQAVLITPTPSTALTGASATFDWTAATGSGNQGYWLFLGSTGVGSKDLYDSGQTTATTATFTKLPTNGETIYARVYTRYNGVLVYNDYTYTAWMEPPVLTTPTPGSTLTGADVTFTWTAAATGNQGYWLFLGTTGVGSKNLYDSGQQTATSATVSGLPTDGTTIYARVYTRYNGVLVYNDYTYHAE